ncbi:MAG: VOC family protein [Verrucomicrobiota bacterium]
MSAEDSTEWPVFPASFHTGLVTRRFFDSWAFYTERLGFRTVDEGGEWVRLVHPSGGQLWLLQEETDAPAAELVPAVEPRGLWLRLEVANPGELAVELRSAGIEAEEVPPGGPWSDGGWRVRDPDGVTVLLIRRPVGGARGWRSMTTLSSASTACA